MGYDTYIYIYICVYVYVYILYAVYEMKEWKPREKHFAAS